MTGTLRNDSVPVMKCIVNETDTKSSTKNDSFASVEISDLLENMKELLNYIKKSKKRKREPEPNTNIRRRDAVRAQGGRGKHS